MSKAWVHYYLYILFYAGALSDNPKLNFALLPYSFLATHGTAFGGKNWRSNENLPPETAIFMNGGQSGSRNRRIWSRIRSPASRRIWMSNLPVSVSRSRPNRGLWSQILPVVSTRIEAKVDRFITVKYKSVVNVCMRKTSSIYYSKVSNVC